MTDLIAKLLAWGVLVGLYTMFNYWVLGWAVEQFHYPHPSWEQAFALTIIFWIVAELMKKGGKKDNE